MDEMKKRRKSFTVHLPRLLFSLFCCLIKRVLRTNCELETRNEWNPFFYNVNYYPFLPVFLLQPKIISIFFIIIWKDMEKSKLDTWWGIIACVWCKLNFSLSRSLSFTRFELSHNFSQWWWFSGYFSKLDF